MANKQLVVMEPKVPDKRKKRVAAYCRVSSLSQEQMHSFDSQVDHYRTLFSEDDSVDFVGIYSDAGISGMRTCTRDGFMRMIEDCRKGLIDNIWTKSVSRFGRNTVDTLIFTRELRSLGVDVFFEKENIHSLDAAGEMMLTLMAAFAESEAEAMSDNIKWGKRRRFENGLTETVSVHNLNGYSQKNGVVTIVESEAEVVRRIYQEYLDGFNMDEIARRLNTDAVPTKKDAEEWTGTQIRNILMNEKYSGDCILQKWYVSDPLRQLHTRNRGELTRYHVEGCYPAIIEKEIWLVVQELIKRNGNKRMNGSDEYPFKGLMTCAVCGQAVIQAYTTNRNRKHTALYRCISRKTNSSVEVPGMTYTPTPKESSIQNPSPEMIWYREKYSKKPESRPYLCSDTRIAFDQPQKAFVQAWNTLISHKIRYLPALENNAESEDILIRYYAEALMELLEAATRLDTFDARLLRRTIDRVDVQPTGKLTFCFRAGIKITA